MVDCQANDDCTSAFPINSLPFVDVSTTRLSTSNGYNSSAHSCNSLDPVLKSNWYQIVSESNTRLSVSIGSGPAFAQLFVYKGNDCNALELVGEAVDDSTTVEWKSEEGKRYYISIGFQPSESSSYSEEYVLTVSIPLFQG
jgi:hypothetical protein